MENFRTKMALLVFSLVYAGCTTPFVEVQVNGEEFSQSKGGGGDCFYPCWGGGGAKFEGDGQEAKVLRVEKNQTVFHLQGENGQAIHLIPTNSNVNIKEGDKVTVEKKGTEWHIK